MRDLDASYDVLDRGTMTVIRSCIVASRPRCLPRLDPARPAGATPLRPGPPTGIPRSTTRLQEVPDRELEDQRVLVGLGVERDTPLEAQRPDRREPAESEADRLAQTVGQRVERPEAWVELDRDGGVLALQPRAVAILEVVCVAHIVEHDAGDPDLLLQRALDLAVEDQLEVDRK